MPALGSLNLGGVQGFVPSTDGVNAAGTPANPLCFQVVNGKLRIADDFVPPAAGATIHASIAAGAPLNVSTAFTQIFRPTNVRLARGGAGVATNYTLTGTRFGVVQSEVIASNGATSVESTKVYDVVTSLTSDVDPTVTTTVQTGLQIGLPNIVTSLDFFGVAATIGGANFVSEAGTLNAARDGVTPVTTMDGTKAIGYRAVISSAQVQP